MKYTFKTPEGKQSVMTRDQLMVLWNNREVPRGSLAAPEGTNEWAPVGVILGAQVAEGGTSESDSASVVESPHVASVAARYNDAYRLAKATTAIGGVLKFLAVCAGGLALLVPTAFASSTYASRGSVGGAALLVGFAAAVALGAPLYALGVLVSAHGQVLRTTLDTAVNTSPLLDPVQKSQILSN